jgi:hypothetical protein
MTKTLVGLALTALTVVGLVGFRHARLQARQQDPARTPQAGDMSDTNMSDMDMSDASPAMASAHLHMGSHMKMTAKRPPAPDDARRAAEIVTTLRGSLEKYKDYRAALADGYRIFLPDIPQPQYHFTNYWRGFEAAWTFDPARPTSLLYKKTADGYQLLGAMYTAPKRTSEDTLNARVPLSVAQWHAHVNICLPPASEKGTADLTKFGFAGSIATADECRRAGGRFQPQIFGWMVHVYPFETTPENIWRH